MTNRESVCVCVCVCVYVCVCVGVLSASSGGARDTKEGVCCSLKGGRVCRRCCFM